MNTSRYCLASLSASHMGVLPVAFGSNQTGNLNLLLENAAGAVIDLARPLLRRAGDCWRWR